MNICTRENPPIECTVENKCGIYNLILEIRETKPDYPMSKYPFWAEGE